MTKSPTPVFFLSHGSTLMLSQDSEPGRFWESIGDEARKRGVKKLLFMGAHWEVTGEGFEIAANPTRPQIEPAAWVPAAKYRQLEIVPDPALAKRVQGLMQARGLKVELNETHHWMHDVYLVLKWMFGETGTTLPCALLSTNAYFDPWKLIDVGAACRPLRYEDVLIIGSGGAVHNLYKNKWSNIVLWRDNFAQTAPPIEGSLGFRAAAKDAFTKSSGPELKSAAIRLMRHPQFREAHGTDDHWAPAMFAAGAAGDEADVGIPNISPAECWELNNMVNVQFQFGRW